MKVVINNCYGGFGLSHKAVMRYAELKGITLYPWIDDISKRVYGDKATLDNPTVLVHYTTVPQEEFDKLQTENELKPVLPGRFDNSNAVYFWVGDIPRNDLSLIKVVTELKSEANVECSKLKIITIPDGIEWEIEEYDGAEWVAEKHRTW